MVEALKKMDKKFLIFAGCIIFLPIFIVIFLVVIRACGTTKITYDKYEEKMIAAAEDYFKDKDLIPSEESDIETVKLTKLVEKGYIKSPGNLLNDDSCKGSVSVRKNGSTSVEYEQGFLNYIPVLDCKNYKTNSLINLILEDLTKEGAGLYELEDGSYIYKGDTVNNYVSFFGSTFRILSIDKEGIVKLLKEEAEGTNVYWDKKYNTETEDTSGKNIYKDSNILKKLTQNYNKDKLTEAQRKKMVSNDICIGKRDINDIEFYSESDCSEILENQPIGLLDVTDFSKASLDLDCVNIKSKSCRNYNYLYYLNLNSWTLNAISNNTYEVYYYESGYLNYQEAENYNFYNLVYYIDKNEIIESGDGSKESPYVIN